MPSHDISEVRALLESNPLGGQADIARALGLTRGAIGRLKGFRTFPTPVQTVNTNTPLWILEEVVDWNARRMAAEPERTAHATRSEF